MFVPDPVAWTEVPESLGVLGRQRDRWHRGLTDTLWRHRRLICNPRYGAMGLVVFPYFVIVELLAPIVEALGLVMLVASLAVGLVDRTFAILFFALAVGIGLVLSVATLLLDQASFMRYRKPGDLGWLIWWAVVENVGYRQLTGVLAAARAGEVPARPVRLGGDDAQGVRHPAGDAAGAAELTAPASEQSSAVDPQPAPCLDVARARRRDEAPESRRVVQLAAVHQLVQQHVLAHEGRGLHQAPVERDGAAARARPPPRLLVAKSTRVTAISCRVGQGHQLAGQVAAARARSQRSTRRPQVVARRRDPARSPGAVATAGRVRRVDAQHLRLAVDEHRVADAPSPIGRRGQALRALARHPRLPAIRRTCAPRACCPTTAA